MSCEDYAAALYASLFGDSQTAMVWESKAVYCWSELQSSTGAVLAPFFPARGLPQAARMVLCCCYKSPSYKSSPDISSASYTSGNRRNLLPRTRFVPLSKPLFGQNYSKICSLSKPFPRTQARPPFLVSRLKRALDLPMHNLDTPPSRKPTTSTQISCSLDTWPSTTSGFVSHHPP